MKINLCVKSGYNFLSSTLKIDKIIDACLENDLECVALLDYKVMFGVKEFYDKCIQNKIKPLIGLEVPVEDFLICLIAKDEIGYKSLVKFSSILSCDSNTSLTIQDLINNKEGLIAIVPSFRGLKRISKEKIIGLLDEIKDIYQEDFYLGKEIYLNNSACIDNNLYIDKLDYKCVAFNNVCCKDDSELEYIELLKAIKDNKIIGYARNNINYEFSSFEFKDYSDSELDNLEVIASKCDFSFSKQELHLAKYENNLGIDSKDYLKNLVYKGLEKRNKSYCLNSEYIKRINYELDVIFNMGFQDYFLIVYDYVKFAKDNKIMVGPGRGSGAGSLVSYCLGITNVNPLEYNLLFERFLNTERMTMPDIDVDFQDNRRDEILIYLKEKYGYSRVANIVTFSTLSSKQVLRDCSKALGLTKKDIDSISKIAHKCPYNASLKEMYEFKEFKEFIDSDDKYKDVYNSALVLEDLPRQSSIHAAGVCLSDIELNNIVPVCSFNNKDLIIQYDMNYVESVGLLKMDLLGLRNLTIIDNCLKDIKRIYNKEINLNKLDLSDPNLYSLLNKGLTGGIFQFESEGMKKTLRLIKPTRFIDVSNVLALYRPGPRDFIEDFNERKNNHKKIVYVDPSLKNILESTYGIIVYQEQIIQIARSFAGYSLAKADILRRAMSKKDKDKMIKIKEDFIKSSISNGHSEKKALEVFELILKFASYGFNKAHSISYALISMEMVYLKVYYPSVFFANVMEMFAFSDKFNDYIKEARKCKIEIMLPSVNDSELEFKSVDENKIIYGLNHIKGLNTLTSKAIINERENGKFIDFYDFVFRMNKHKVNKEQIRILIDSGCLDKFLYNRASLKYNLDKVLEYVKMFSYSENGQIILDDSLVDKPKIEVISEDNDKLEVERNLLGVYISEFPLTKDRDRLNSLGYINPFKISSYNNKSVNFVGLLKNNKVIKTKKGEVMAILTFIDEVNSYSVMVFPKLYSEISSIISVGNYYDMNVRVEVKEEISLIANDIKTYILGGK